MESLETFGKAVAALFVIFCVFHTFGTIANNLFKITRRKGLPKAPYIPPRPPRPFTAGQYLVNVGVNMYPHERPMVKGLDGVDRDIVIMMETYASAKVRQAQGLDREPEICGKTNPTIYDSKTVNYNPKDFLNQ